MLRYFVFLAAIFAVTNARIANPCVRNPGVLPVTTVVEGCSAPPCQVYTTRTTDIRISFRAPRRLNNMLTLVTGYMTIGNNLLPFQVDLGAASNTCNHLTNARCPVNQGDTVNYTLRLQARNLPAGHNMPLEIRIVDHGPMVCVNIPVRVMG